MTDHEKEILDKIKQSTEKTPVPESLAPDQIMKMLEDPNRCPISVNLIVMPSATSICLPYGHGTKYCMTLIASSIV